MKSRRHHRSTKRSRWAWNNSHDGLRNRRASADATREERTADLPPVYAGPEPLSHWQTVQVLGSSGQVLHSITLRVPVSGRCDQHAAEIDGARSDRMMTATEIGRTVAGWIAKRPSTALLADLRRETHA